MSLRALNVKFSQKEGLVWASQNKLPKNPSGGGSESPETQVNESVGRNQFLLRLHRYAQKCEHNVSVKNIIKYQNCAENGYNEAKEALEKLKTQVRNFSPTECFAIYLYCTIQYNGTTLSKYTYNFDRLPANQTKKGFKKFYDEVIKKTPKAKRSGIAQDPLYKIFRRVTKLHNNKYYNDRNAFDDIKTVSIRAKSKTAQNLVEEFKQLTKMFDEIETLLRTSIATNWNKGIREIVKKYKNCSSRAFTVARSYLNKLISNDDKLTKKFNKFNERYPEDTVLKFNEKDCPATAEDAEIYVSDRVYELITLWNATVQLIDDCNEQLSTSLKNIYTDMGNLRTNNPLLEVSKIIETVLETCAKHTTNPSMLQLQQFSTDLNDTYMTQLRESVNNDVFNNVSLQPNELPWPYESEKLPTDKYPIISLLEYPIHRLWDTVRFLYKTQLALPETIQSLAKQMSEGKETLENMHSYTPKNAHKIYDIQQTWSTLLYESDAYYDDRIHQIDKFIENVAGQFLNPLIRCNTSYQSAANTDFYEVGGPQNWDPENPSLMNYFKYKCPIPSLIPCLTALCDRVEQFCKANTSYENLKISKDGSCFTGGWSVKSWLSSNSMPWSAKCRPRWNKDSKPHAIKFYETKSSYIYDIGELLSNSMFYYSPSRGYSTGGNYDRHPFFRKLIYLHKPLRRLKTSDLLEKEETYTKSPFFELKKSWHKKLIRRGLKMKEMKSNPVPKGETCYCFL